jgi:tetratricopeptide (TPR) repeat protein
MSDDLRRLTADAVTSLRSALAAGHGVGDALREGFARNTVFFHSVFLGVLFHALGDDPNGSEIEAFAVRLGADWLSEPQAYEPHEVEAVLRVALGDISMMRSLRRHGLNSPEIPVAVMDNVFAAWRPTPAELDELFGFAATAEPGMRVIAPSDLWADPGDPARERERQLAGIKLDKEAAEPLIHRARMAASAGYREMAVADYDSAIILDPGNVMALMERGAQRNLLGQRAEALADFERAMILDPGNASAYAGRANVRDDEEQHELALADYDRALELAPGNPWTLSRRATALSCLGRYPEALADASRAIETDPSAHMYACRASIYHDMGRYADALADYDRALRADPPENGHLASRALTYQAMGRYEDALADFDRAIELNPGEAWLLAGRGELLEDMGRAADAKADFARAIELEPSFAEEFGDRS